MALMAAGSTDCANNFKVKKSEMLMASQLNLAVDGCKVGDVMVNERWDISACGLEESFNIAILYDKNGEGLNLEVERVSDSSKSTVCSFDSSEMV